VAAELHRVGRIGSTMDHLHQLAEQGAPAGTAILAEAQTGGRGSRGRAWHSALGGLWLSVLYRPASPDGAELLSLRLGLRAAEALEAAAPGLPVLLKWPNDLIVSDRKLGGILCEARWQGESLAWIAAGVGLNVTNPIPDELRLTATALGEHLPVVTVEAILPGLLDALRHPLPDADRLTPDENRQLERRDWLRGRRLRAPLGGRAEGIAADGALLIRTDDGITPVRAGHVELADGSSTR
jgi:BirA family transcriptional regulator, biotin operon repressor / biotin---[acetyl-CoA-carboxylase] ligase